MGSSPGADSGPDRWGSGAMLVASPTGETVPEPKQVVNVREAIGVRSADIGVSVARADVEKWSSGHVAAWSRGEALMPRRGAGAAVLAQLAAVAGVATTVAGVFSAVTRAATVVAGTKTVVTRAVTVVNGTFSAITRVVTVGETLLTAGKVVVPTVRMIMREPSAAVPIGSRRGYRLTPGRARSARPPPAPHRASPPPGPPRRCRSAGPPPCSQ